MLGQRVLFRRDWGPQEAADGCGWGHPWDRLPPGSGFLWIQVPSLQQPAQCQRSGQGSSTSYAQSPRPVLRYNTPLASHSAS